MSKPSPEFLKRAVFLVDSSSYIFRAYYAIRQPLSAPDGTPTHATHGFLAMTHTLMDQYKPERCVFLWDTREKGFRHEIFEKYKANRQIPPADLGLQIENVRKLLDVLGYPQLMKVGFEADDIFCTLIKHNPEVDFVIVTSDKDLLQLVGPHVWCLDTMRNKWSNIDEAKEKFGVDPAHIAEVQALSGDTVDNIPGAPGIGPKTATELISHFGSLEAVLAEARVRRQNPPKKIDDPLKGKRIEAIADNEEQVRTSLKLVSLHPDAPIERKFESFVRGEIKKDELMGLLSTLGFHQMLKRYSLEPEAEGLPAGAAVDLSQRVTDFKTTQVKDVAQLKEIFAANESASRMSLDTETFSLGTQDLDNLVGLSFAFTSDEGFYVPLRHKFETDEQKGKGENVDTYDVLKLLEKFLKARPAEFSVILQNAKFDLHAFAGEGLDWPKTLRIDDTMVMSYVVDPTQKHGMDALAMKYLNGYQTLHFEELVPKDSNFSEVPLDKATFYAAEDAVVTLRLGEILLTQLKEQNLFAVYDLLDRPLVQILFAVERNGVGVDAEKLRKLAVELRTELVDLDKKAQRMLLDYGCRVPEDGLNFGSPKQLADILYEQLKLPVLKKGKTGPSTDASVLEELSLQHPFPELILEIRELSKLLSTYIEPLPDLINPRSHRLHTEFMQTIAATGRLASSNPNLQNIPIRTERGRKIRDAFVAADGFQLVGIDYSQIELRVLAHVSRDPELIRAFNDGADIHRRTAALIMKKPESEISDDERRAAKTINFGIIYGQSAFGLSKTLKISRAEAQQFIEAYNRAYPGIDKFADEAIAQAKKSGFSETLTGRKRPIPDLQSKNFAVRGFGERVAVNTPIQGTAADLVKAAMTEAQRVIKDAFPQARMVLQVHDELLFEVPNADVEKFQARMVEVMEDPSLLKAFNIKGFDVVMKAEASHGHDWGQL